MSNLSNRLLRRLSPFSPCIDFRVGRVPALLFSLQFSKRSFKLLDPLGISVFIFLKVANGLLLRFLLLLKILDGLRVGLDCSFKSLDLLG